MLKVAVIGATGYIGIELIRVLLNHPKVKLNYLTAHTQSGHLLNEVYPHLPILDNLRCSAFDIDQAIASADLLFIALPHGNALHIVPKILDSGKKVIDFSADFRLKEPSTYEHWYHHPGASREILEKAVYGLPELGLREEIKQANFIANPGCYPTCAILGAMPAIAANLIDTDQMIFDAKSGISGSGRTLLLSSHYCEVSENFKAYAIAGEHRHTPEIEQMLSSVTGKKVFVQFTPHLVPMIRGLLVTSYFSLTQECPVEQIWDIYFKTYENEPFIRVLPLGQLPQTANVRASNYCDIGLQVDLRTNRLIVISAIDNLIKGAVGTAVQNMNLMHHFPEGTGLTSLFTPYP